MNIKTGIRTAALALPLALAPIKSSAQNISKQAKKVVKDEAMHLKGGIGVGAGIEPFFNQAKFEPKLIGNLGFYTHNMNGSIDARIGKNSQTIIGRLAHPIRTSNPDLEMEAGGVVKYNHINKNENISPIVLKGDFASTDIPLYAGSNSIGFYGEAGYKLSPKLHIKGSAEVGSYMLTEKGSIPAKNSVISSDIVKDVKESGVVGNFQAGAKYDITKYNSVEAELGYSTLHKTPSVLVSTKINF